jgi:uncharacterized membrane protein YkoI
VGAQHIRHYVFLSDRVHPRDIAALNSSKLTLDQAITAAESQTHERAVEARFQTDPQGPQYAVWVMKNGRVMKTLVDADTGKVTDGGRGLSLHRLYPSERRDFVMAVRAKADLADAVAITEATSKSKALAAALDRTEGISAYHVRIATGKGLETVWVSPNNPTIIASK